ncbi:hypothetical protein [Melghirimyces algeriensis]|uniref:ABC-2 family transporter protein n=1 Tax=Melghirimyces algeriensis TaxID=910412 RepID=A0A521FHD1_9BACL|nr:hypothetical protein [Melghirimyces algeriensis]SMO95638.1 hypothetical protein SAMN06264849_12012 [Melghirimyces algeriensis]
MILFEMEQLIDRQKKRWLLLLLTLLAVSIASKFLIGSDIRSGFVTNAWDFMLASVTQMFFAIVIIPVIYLLSISDLVIRDMNGFLHYVLFRAKNRYVWWLAKFILLFLHAVLVVCFTLFCLWIAALFWGFPLTGPVLYPHYAIMETPFVFASIFAIHTLALFALGLLVTLISLWTKSVIISGCIGLLLCVVAFGTHIYQPDIAGWLPTTPMRLDLHHPYNPHRTITNFTVQHSVGYLFFLITIFHFLGALRIRCMNFFIKERS